MNIKIPDKFSYLDINSQWEKALASIYEGQYNTLIVGNAGSGKSSLIHLMKELDRINGINSLYLAPTGIASVNIGGSTIHSAFKLGVQMIDPSLARLSNETRQLLSLTSKIVVDESSMLRADILDILDKLCKEAKNDDRNLFGNIQVVLIGDLFQLPPIIGRSREEKDFFQEMYGDNSFFFGSDAYKFNEDTFNKIEFKHIYRQDNSDFKDILNRIRVGEQTDKDLEIINSKNIPYRRYKREFADGIYISPFNDTVSKINEEALAKLPSKEIVFKAYIDGYINPKNFLVPIEIKVKEGAKIMMLVNSPNKEYQNGTIGTFIKIIDYNTILVELNGRKIEISKHEFAEYKYSTKGKELVEEKKGSFKQFPIRLSYAITTHKSQSCTFTEGYIDFGYSLGFTDHLAYVMLSRFSDLNTIGLKRDLTHDDIHVSMLVKDFMNTFVEDYVPPPREVSAPYENKSLDAWGDDFEDDIPF